MRAHRGAALRRGAGQALLLGALLGGCGDGAALELGPGALPPTCFGAGAPLFADATLASGVRHVHRAPAGAAYYLRNVGGGVAIEDLDGDGDLDLYLSNGAGPKGLYLNRGDGTFDERAAAAGAAFPQDWTLGVAAADVDGDGDADLLLLNRGPCRLLRNEGGARFRDLGEAAGLGACANAASASFADLDGDGDLDLLIAELAAAYDPVRDAARPGRSRLNENRGDGTFAAAPTTLPESTTYLGILADLDGDDRPDLLLPEEFGTGSPNRLFRNLGPGDAARWPRLAEVTAGAGVALPRSVMGVAVLDLEGDGLPDLLLTNLLGQAPNREVLLTNRGALRFADVAPARGAHAMARAAHDSARAVSWGVLSEDLDNDGLQDLYLVYGHFEPTEEFSLPPSFYAPMRPGQPNALLLGRAPEGGEEPGLHFRERPGSCAEESGRGRGVAAGDLDGDGCLDLVVVNQDGPARLLRGLCPGGGGSLEVELRGRGGRSAVGAQLSLSAGGRRQLRHLIAGSSVHSSLPRRLHFGLGEAAAVDELRVRWPGGGEQVLRGLPRGRPGRPLIIEEE